MSTGLRLEHADFQNKICSKSVGVSQHEKKISSLRHGKLERFRYKYILPLGFMNVWGRNRKDEAAAYGLTRSAFCYFDFSMLEKDSLI